MTSNPTFEQVARHLFQDTLPRRYTTLYLLPALMTAAGAALGLLLGWLPHSTIIGTATLVAAYTAATRRDQRPAFAPASAAAYLQRLRTELPGDAMDAIADAVAECKTRGIEADVYRITCACGQIICTCENRVRAAVAPFGPRYAIIAVGDRLADTTGQLRFVLAHELGHLAGLHRVSQNAWHAANTLGFAIIGLHATGWTLVTAFIAWRLVCSLWYAVNEAACDIRAARRYGYEAAAYWKRRVEAARLARSARPVWHRLVALPVQVLPMHPPLRVRAWYCRIVGTRR